MKTSTLSQTSWSQKFQNDINHINPSPSNHMNAFNVYLPLILLDDGQGSYGTITLEDSQTFALIDIVCNQSEDPEHVRDWLINHDWYSQYIVVLPIK